VNFSGGFCKWIFHWKIHWKKFESYKKICLLVKFTVKKINPIKPRILLGKNLLVNFKNGIIKITLSKLASKKEW
jgi:hypothetical protein